MRSRTVHAASLAAVVALLVGGCSGDPSPTPGPTSAAVDVVPTPSATPALPTPAPTPTWPPTVALPTPPPEMTRDDETGAVAAAKYFLDLYTYTESSQDTGPWEAMSHPDCVFCKSIVDDVARMRADNKFVIPARIDVKSQRTMALAPLVYNVALDVATGPDEVRDLDGRLIDAGVVEGGLMTLVVYFQDGSWLVRGVELEQLS